MLVNPPGCLNSAVKQRTPGKAVEIIVCRHLSRQDQAMLLLQGECYSGLPLSRLFFVWYLFVTIENFGCYGVNVFR